MASQVHSTPKIALFDLDGSADQAIIDAGFNVTLGSFGQQYDIEKISGYHPVLLDDDIPDALAEQDIVVINLVGEVAGTPPDVDKSTPLDEDDWWSPGSAGYVDPRPRSMVSCRSELNTVAKHQGVFIIFAAPRSDLNMVIGPARVKNRPVDTRLIRRTIWSFLSFFDDADLVFSEANGNTVNVLSERTRLNDLLRKHAGSARYRTIINSVNSDLEELTVLARNKFGEAVAAMIAPVRSNEEYLVKNETGWIFIFPDIKDKGSFLVEFLKDVLPEITPEHFPFLEKQSWIHTMSYEMPEVLALEQQIVKIRTQANAAIEELQVKIDECRKSNEFIYDLIRQTGTPLKNAVLDTLLTLGFSDVLDADQEGDLDEDLQIRDASPLLLVEVKGLNGDIGDDDALQVAKHIAPRMKKLKTTDVQGLAIINHERGLPPLQRKQQPFREIVVTSAEKSEVGLLTTWELYKLVRGFLAHDWQPEFVKPLFYQTGKIDAIPTHYKYIGKVEKFYPKNSAVTFNLEGSDLAKGSRVAFALPNEFVEQEVESLQVDKVSVEVARDGELAGITTPFSREQLQRGVQVYLINTK